MRAVASDQAWGAEVVAILSVAAAMSKIWTAGSKVCLASHAERHPGGGDVNELPVVHAAEPYPSIVTAVRTATAGSIPSVLEWVLA
jgi:hypothetical protein